MKTMRDTDPGETARVVKAHGVDGNIRVLNQTILVL